MAQASAGRRRSVPRVEGLEERRLLSNTAQAVAFNPATLEPGQAPPTARELGEILPTDVRRVNYTTPQGTHVTINIYGVGSLAGTKVQNGALSLVFSGTNFQTGIIATVRGGTGHALLDSVSYAGVSPEDLSGVGGTLLNILNLKDFDLINGGVVDLEAGVHSVFLNSIGRDSQLHLRELPEQLQANTTSTTASGLSLGFIDSVLGAQTLSSVGGQFVATTSTMTQPAQGTSGPPPAPPGAVIVVHHVRGTPRNDAAVGDAQVFGYDPTAGALIRFNVHFDPTTGAGTGTPNLSIPLAGPIVSGVALARYHGQLVALVSDGTTVRAYSATAQTAQSAFVGSFTVNPAALGLPNFTKIDEMGATGTLAVIGDSTAGANHQGLLQGLNVDQSLDTGHAVVSGAPFSPTREFEFAGGLTGVAGSTAIYAVGAGHFDQFQPNLTQLGVMSVNTVGAGSSGLGTQLAEIGRGPILSNGQPIDVGPMGTVSSNPIGALGSIDRNLALVTALSNGQNVVTLYGPQSLSVNGTVTLADPHLLTGLSESFHTNLAGSALVDVQGNVQSFRASDAQGLVLNVAGNLNLVKAGRIADSVIVGEPFGHVDVQSRSNVNIFSTSRVVGERGGVILQPALRPLGPLAIP